MVAKATKQTEATKRYFEHKIVIKILKYRLITKKKYKTVTRMLLKI